MPHCGNNVLRNQVSRDAMFDSDVKHRNAKALANSEPHEFIRGSSQCDEWIQVLDATNDSDTLWHWKQVCFWGLEAVSASNHAARGGAGARFWTLFANSARSENIGFRPVLEILPSIVVTPNCNLDGHDFYWDALPDYSNFCPVLQPTNQDVFANVQAGQSVRMYTLLKNGEPVCTDTGRKSKFQNVLQLELTDRYYGDEYLIPWTISNGMAVAERALLQQV